MTRTHRARPTRVWTILAVSAALLTPLLFLAPTISSAQDFQEEAVVFRTLEIYLDSGPAPLAAYQIEIKDSSQSVKLVGLEGGAPAAFAAPPYYDSRALMSDRIVIASYSTDQDLPTGRFRVLSLSVVGSSQEPEYSIELVRAVNLAGEDIAVEITTKERSH